VDENNAFLIKSFLLHLFHILFFFFLYRSLFHQLGQEYKVEQSIIKIQTGSSVSESSGHSITSREKRPFTFDLLMIYDYK